MSCSGEREAHHQVALRARNELAAARADRSPGSRLTLACECGDCACDGQVEATGAEYEAVRQYGSRFLILRTHENAETSVVVSTHPRYDVIESFAGEPRRIVLSADPRGAALRVA